MDRRDRDHRWYHSFDERTMEVTLEECGEDGEDRTLPVKYEVCETCEGKGSHVNPSIDAHGISPEEFAEDPEFAEEYFAGRYDQPCNECHGNRVSPVLDEERATPEEVAWLNRYLDERASYMAECEAERRMGA